MSTDLRSTCESKCSTTRNNVGAWMEIVTLLAVASFLAYSYFAGKLGGFVAPCYIWLSPAAAVVLFAMCIVRCHAHFGGYVSGELDEEPSAWQVPLSACVIVLLAPVVLGLVVNPQRLSPEGARKREIKRPPYDTEFEDAYKWVLGLKTAKTEEGDAGSTVTLPKDPSVLDLITAATEDGPRALEGQFVTVLGQCDLPTGPDSQRFSLYRLVITCCIADATAVSVEVSRKPSKKLEPGGWIRAGGILKFDNPMDPSLPVVHAKTIAPVPEPSEPYL